MPLDNLTVRNYKKMLSAQYQTAGQLLRKAQFLISPQYA